MRNFRECTLWGDMSSDRTSDQYPVEKLCLSCIRKFSKPDQEVIVSVGPDAGKGPGAECYFSETH